ncbi:MAG: PAS domain S-box protein [Methanocalculus sp. MSAO_Arc2]|nr:MAG: PAS domain S-box protein [Methanocalculus sp. MSAO_Arc2]
MQTQTEDLIKIKDILKRYPRGMSITEISSALHIHRNTAAKQLDILRLKGDVDRKQIGTARNYFLVQRVPVSSLIEYWPAPLIVCDAHQNTVMITDGVLALLGCSLDVLYGMPINTIPISLFNDARIVDICHDAIQGRSRSITIRTTIRKQELLLRITGIPVVFDSGRDGAALAFFDRTEMQNTLQALERLKQKYSSLISGQTEYIVHIKPDLTITFLNAPFAYRAGRSEEQIHGMTFLSFFPANTHEDIRNLFGKISMAEPLHRCELPMIRLKGTPGREEWEIRGIFDEQGGVTTFHAIGRDITELYHCREQLEQYHRNLENIIDERTRSMQEANRMLMATIREKEELEKELLFVQFAFDHASDSILIMNEEGQIIRANKTAAALLGYPPEELTALTVHDINPAITGAVWKEMWADSYPGKREQTVAIHRRRNGRVIPVEVSRSFVRFLDRMYFCSIARPIDAGDEA